MDPARVLGFRDSYLFFLRNPQLVRVNTTVEERTWMIENGMLMANFKSKLIAVVTARSIFKSFGHRIIKRGRSKVDDYYESRAHEDRSGGKRKHTLLHSENPGRQVTDLNWLYESAMAVRALNSQLKDLRKENPKFLDPHTNMEQIPASKQPTRCEVTAAPKPPQQEADAQLTNPLNSTVLSIPRSIGPQVDASDPNIWAVIPEDIRKALEAAEATKPKEEENEDLTKFPLSLLEGQFQAAFPVHQARFRQPYRVVLPQSMTAHAHYIHHLHTTQSRGESGPVMEQELLPGQVSAQDARLNQLHQLQQQQQQQQMLQQQQQQLQQQHLQQAKLQQQQELTNKKPDTPPVTPLKTGLGYCQRLVSTQGEHCPNHRGSNVSQSGTPTLNGKAQTEWQSICGECNSATAPPSALPTDKPLPCSMSHLNQCKTCAKTFHPLCLQLDTPRIVSAIASYPWQCNDCKLCVVCMDAGDEASLLICDDCDRGWHMSCCDPAIKEVPKEDWLCSYCAMCHSCRGTEASTTKYKHAVSSVTGSNKYPTYLCTYCSNCHDNFSKGRFCPVCLRTYRGDGGEDDSDAVGEDENNMVCCDECNRWVHMDCDGELSEEKVEEMGRDESLKYTCPPCAGKVTPLRPGAHTSVNVADVTPEAAMQSLQGLALPQPKVCGHLGGKMRIRGLVEHQGKKLGVPEIIGTGVEYDRKMVAEMTARKSKSLGGGKRRKGRQSTKSPAATAARRASIASSTSSLSSLTGSVDS
ncbi:chromatin remodelling complex Rsc7/Swp82 subunit-domain-containing protein [Dissophora ornata]|nr:chromatin remodelling complex Rsc7/Swp82 subunit-domain-containing protein [Dissophora ornata]